MKLILLSNRYIELDTFKQIFVACDKKFIADLKFERFIENPSCKDATLYLMNEYLSTNFFDPSVLLNSEKDLVQYERWKNQR